MNAKDDKSSPEDGRRADASPSPPPIVIIDDDKAVQDSLISLTRGLYDVIACDSAEVGINAVNEETCAVILDLKLPGHNGLWACAQIRKKVPDVPIVFYSTYETLKEPYAVINEHRPFGYVYKGDNVQKLLDLLSVAVSLQSIYNYNQKLIRLLRKGQPTT
jgi:DNA-binding NtrC family response regulator